MERLSCIVLGVIRIIIVFAIATAIVNFNLLEPADIAVSERDETISRRSVFGRINYAYDNRYLFSASLRRDGDSRFGANERYATFPALSLGWNEVPLM